MTPRDIDPSEGPSAEGHRPRRGAEGEEHLAELGAAHAGQFDIDVEAEEASLLAQAAEERDLGEEGAIGVLRRALRSSPELGRGIRLTVAMAVATALGRLVIPVLIQQTLD